jgi:hypothetical protein
MVPGVSTPLQRHKASQTRPTPSSAMRFKTADPSAHAGL